MTRETMERREAERMACKTREELFAVLDKQEEEFCKELPNAVDCPDPTIDYLELSRFMYPDKEDKSQQD